MQMRAQVAWVRMWMWGTGASVRVCEQGVGVRAWERACGCERGHGRVGASAGTGV